jgi:hypothetical protein
MISLVELENGISGMLPAFSPTRGIFEGHMKKPVCIVLDNIIRIANNKPHIQNKVILVLDVFLSCRSKYVTMLPKIPINSARTKEICMSTLRIAKSVIKTTVNDITFI